MKNILICGASKNLGKYILEKFSKKNNVIGISRSDVNKKNYFKVDLNSKIQTKKILNKIKRIHKKLDAIIFCVGNSKKNYKNFANSDNFKEAFNYNFYSFVNLLDYYLETFKTKPTKIIVISSIAGLTNINAPISYSLTKNALNFYCKIQSKELAKKKIFINIISPGNILMENNNWSKKIKKDKNLVKKYIYNNVPSNKFCDPNEIYKICDLIVSNDTNFVGSNIVVDGGQVL